MTFCYKFCYSFVTTQKRSGSSPFIFSLDTLIKCNNVTKYLRVGPAFSLYE